MRSNIEKAQSFLALADFANKIIITFAKHVDSAEIDHDTKKICDTIIKMINATLNWSSAISIESEPLRFMQYPESIGLFRDASSALPAEEGGDVESLGQVREWADSILKADRYDHAVVSASESLTDVFDIIGDLCIVKAREIREATPPRMDSPAW